MITATELYQYIFEELVPAGASSHQTPGIWPLKAFNKGEFIFLNPNHALNTLPDPPLDDANNPWLGLEAYSESNAQSFFGRQRVVDALLDRAQQRTSPLLAIVGASGIGKSSIIKAGLLPILNSRASWSIVQSSRLTAEPGAQLDLALHALASAPAGQRKLLFIDQFEELYTQCTDSSLRAQFIRRLRQAIDQDSELLILITLRSDFEPRTANQDGLRDLWQAARFVVPPLNSEELRQVIEAPAAAKAVFFEPATLVDKLLDEALAMPGALPLLSFALAEMYRHAQARRRERGSADRALSLQDYEAIGGVVGALHKRATVLFDQVDAKHRETIRRIFLRLVSQEGARLTRRRIHQSELEFDDVEERSRVERIVHTFVAARLLVIDHEFIEPAHDTLVVAWENVQDWLTRSGTQALMRAVWRAASEWNVDRDVTALLWDRDPRLPQLATIHAELNRLERQFQASSLSRRDRQRRWLAGTIAAVVAALSGATVYSIHQARVAQASAAEAQDRAITATASASDSTNRLLLLLEVDQVDRTPTANNQLMNIATHAEAPVATAVLRGHTDSVTSAAFSACGDRVVTTSMDHTARLWNSATGAGVHVWDEFIGPVYSATFDAACKRVLTASGDGRAVVWDVATGAEVAQMQGHRGTVLSATFDSTGKRIVTASIDQTARVWNAEMGAELAVLEGHEGSVGSAEFNVTGTRVVTASYDETARVWDSVTGRQLAVLVGHAGDVGSATFNAGADLVVTTSAGDKTARLWNAVTGKGIVELKGHTGRIYSAAFDGSEQRVLTASDDGTARLWDVATGSQLRVFRGHAGAVFSAQFNRAGDRVATASDDTTVRIWDAATGDSLKVLRGHAGRVIAATFNATGDRVITASLDNTARIWNVSDDTVLPVFNGHTAAFNATGDRLVTGLDDNTARLWNSLTGQQLTVLKGHTDRLNSTVFNVKGDRVVTASDDNTARLWDITLGQELAILKGHTAKVNAAVFDATGTWIATASDDKTARLWKVADGSNVQVLRGHTRQVAVVVFNAAGDRVVTTSYDDTARIWDVASGTQLQVLSGHTSAIYHAAFNAATNRIATASNDATARIWDGATGQSIAVLKGHTARVIAVEFDATGDRVVTASLDETARLWDSATGKELAVLKGHAGPVNAAAFNPAGDRVVTASDDKTARLWDSATGRELAVFQGHTEGVDSVAFNVAGDLVVTASHDGTSRTWAVGATLLQALARSRTHACLDPATRSSILGESDAIARSRHTACEACVPVFFDNLGLEPTSSHQRYRSAWATYKTCLTDK